MIPRFRRPSSALAAPTSNSCGSEQECRCCQAVRRARELALFDLLPEWSSPLTPGVQAVNLHPSEDGRTLWADLGDDWARMLGQLPLSGPGLLMTRNEAAILGRRMEYPALTLTTGGGGKGASGSDGLWLDLRHLGAARAVHMRRKAGHVFGVEFADEVGSIIHRFTLTAESDMDEFFAWVRLHQACTAHEPPMWLDEEEVPAAREPQSSLRHCGGEALVAIVTACLEREIPLQATVRNAAVTHRAEFTPRSLEPSDGWWFASDDATGLHFQPELFSQITVEHSSRSTGRGAAVVYAGLGVDVVALALEAGTQADDGAWQSVIEAIL